MDLQQALATYKHEQVSLSYEPTSGYFGIIAIHDTTLGPALGGTRFWQYASTDDAITDALRLARGMTYKAAVAGVNLGGGKSVIVGDNKRKDREALFRAHGAFVESLNGRYITAEDVGTSPADMEYIHSETSHVVGLHGKSGDPSPVTAYGVYMGMKAAAKSRWGSDALSGKTVAMQGCGNVAKNLAGLLKTEGAKLIVTDIDQARVRSVVEMTGATAVEPDAIYDQKADIFSPNALGAIINDDTLKRLKVEIICGGANNQLKEERHGAQLEQQGMTYAPDYVVNGGGLINVYGELQGWALERAKRKAGDIYDTTLAVYAIASASKIPSYAAADKLAEQRIEAIKPLRKIYIG